MKKNERNGKQFNDSQYKFEKLGNELKQARKTAGLTQTEVAKKLQINAVTLSSYETGRIKAPMGFLSDAAKLYGVELSDFLKQLGEAFYPVQDLMKIPILTAKVQYTDRSEFFMANDPVGFEYADVSRPKDYVYLAAPDNSMSDFRILENDLVLIEKGQEPRNDELVAALVGGYPVIRKYEALTGSTFNLKYSKDGIVQILKVENGVADGHKVELLGVIKRLVVIY